MVTKNTTLASPPSGPDVPSKGLQRPAGYDRDVSRYQIQFGRIPLKIRKQGHTVPIDNPFRDVAVFVVHGIGNQADTETAVSLRRGVEDAVPLIDPGYNGPNQSNQWIVPPPYIYDGFWAIYDEFKWLWGKEERSVLTARQRKFFERAVRSRSGGWIRNCGWLVKQGVKLVKEGGVHRWPVYIPLTVFSALLYVLVVVPNLRKKLAQFVNDARLYLEPNGDIELETVQLIDYRIGEMFLKMLGLDWDLETLPTDEQLIIGGFRHRFERVIWVAHSLGSVISYNVISDLLHRCKEIRRDHPSRNSNVERLESGLQHFITMGSPLDKVFFLFGHGGTGVLRPWPEEYLPRGTHDLTRNYAVIDADLAVSKSENPANGWQVNFWLNFFYGSDPISGPLDSFASGDSKWVKNLSPVGWRVPLISHVAYWTDVSVVSKILELAYSGYVKPHRIRLWPIRFHNWLSGIGIVSLATLTAGAILGIWVYRTELWTLLRKFLFGG